MKRAEATAEAMTEEAESIVQVHHQAEAKIEREEAETSTEL